MKSILITGANRGLGLGILKTLLKSSNPPSTVIATCRNIEQAQELKQLADENSNVHILELDVKEPETFPDFSKKVEEIVQGNGLNVLLNNAGVSPKPCRINFVREEQFYECYKVNTVGPIMLTKALLPLLKKAAQVNSSEKISVKKAAVLNMSSVLGSIGWNVDGMWHPYRCSKVALNIFTKGLSVELKEDGILVTSIHPGWVKTDLGGAQAPMEVEESVTQVTDLINSLEEKHNGGFYMYDGKEIPW